MSMQYRHYKGGLYEVISPYVTHTETGETMVVYRSLDDGKVWARPQKMFFETVVLGDGTEVPRFEKYGQ